MLAQLTSCRPPPPPSPKDSPIQPRRPVALSFQQEPPPINCRLLSFCAHVAARLPFKRCDEPYTLLHLINATISRRAAFVLSAQKAALDAGLQQEPKLAADTTIAPNHQQGHAGGHAGPQDSDAAAPEHGDRAMKSSGGAEQSAAAGTEAAAETPGNAVGDQVGLRQNLTPVHGREPRLCG